MKEFDDLMNTLKALREPNGCPWDKDQTPLSMRSDLIEECFEAIDAITQDDAVHVKEELGDLIFNALVMAYMYEQKGSFKVEEVFSEINSKLIRRHPHVFAQSEGASQMQTKPQDSQAVLNQWEKIKHNVEGRTHETVLDEVPKGFPPILRGSKMLKKASKKHFDWKNSDEALLKIKEELKEVESASQEVLSSKKDPNDKPFTVSTGNKELNEKQLHLEEEIGDLLLATVNYARLVSVDSEVALNRANEKFYKRFSYIEKQMNKKNIPMTQDHQDIMIELWNEAKKLN